MDPAEGAPASTCKPTEDEGGQPCFINIHTIPMEGEKEDPRNVNASLEEKEEGYKTYFEVDDKKFSASKMDGDEEDNTGSQDIQEKIFEIIVRVMTSDTKRIDAGDADTKDKPGSAIVGAIGAFADHDYNPELISASVRSELKIAVENVLHGNSTDLKNATSAANVDYEHAWNALNELKYALDPPRPESLEGVHELEDALESLNLVSLNELHEFIDALELPNLQSFE